MPRLLMCIAEAFFFLTTSSFASSFYVEKNKAIQQLFRFLHEANSKNQLIPEKKKIYDHCLDKSIRVKIIDTGEREKSFISQVILVNDNNCSKTHPSISYYPFFKALRDEVFGKSKQEILDYLGDDKDLFEYSERYHPALDFVYHSSNPDPIVGDKGKAYLIKNNFAKVPIAQIDTIEAFCKPVGTHRPWIQDIQITFAFNKQGKVNFFHLGKY